MCANMEERLLRLKWLVLSRDASENKGIYDMFNFTFDQEIIRRGLSNVVDRFWTWKL